MELIWGWVVEGAFEHDEPEVLSGYSGGAVQREGTNSELKLSQTTGRFQICPYNSDGKSSVSRRYGVKRGSRTPWYG